MTQNQINYQRHLEDVRHNKLSESAALAQLQEMKRHNQASLAETYRHNTAMHQDWAMKNAINSNIASNQIAEQQRSNMANEAIGRTNAQTNRYNAETNRYSAAVGEYNAETGRINANTQATHVANQYSLGLANVDVAKSNVDALLYKVDTEARYKAAQALTGLIPSMSGILGTNISGSNRAGKSSYRSVTQRSHAPNVGGRKR